jgi:hypothetical protein
VAPETAARKQVILELGGNAAAVVLWPDQLPAVARIPGAFAYAGGP